MTKEKSEISYKEVGLCDNGNGARVFALLMGVCNLPLPLDLASLRTW